MDSCEEIWRDVVGYEGYYEVSSYGNVRGLDRQIDTKHGGRFVKGKQLRLHKSIDGYVSVDLSANGVAKSQLVHRLVAQAFIPNPNNLPCINHKDEDKHNNYVGNLEWCTYAYNNDYSKVSERAAEVHRGKHLSDAHKQALSIALKASGLERARKRMQTIQERYPDGIRPTEEHKRKTSESLKGIKRSDETRQKMSKPKSEEHRQHIREAQKILREARRLGMTYKEYKAMMESDTQIINSMPIES